MSLDSLAQALAVLSGSAVGFVLGLLGSGGSILALPLLVYVVGYEGAPHVAIGTTALAVGASALANVAQHARRGNVRLATGAVFAAPGVLGALVGARLGLLTPGDKLLFLFAAVMMLVAWNMWRNGKAADASPASEAPLDRRTVLRLLPAGFLVGTLSGYFGIGGGFLIVPALAWAARLDVRAAIGTSLVAVATFGFTTASRYAWAGEIDLPVAGLFIAGGVAGGVVGTLASHRAPRERLRHLFAGVLVVVSLFMLYRNYTAFFGA